MIWHHLKRLHITGLKQPIRGSDLSTPPAKLGLLNDYFCLCCVLKIIRSPHRSTDLKPLAWAMAGCGSKMAVKTLIPAQKVELTSLLHLLLYLSFCPVTLLGSRLHFWSPYLYSKAGAMEETPQTLRFLACLSS